MSNQTDMQEIQLDIDDAKEIIAMSDALGRLEHNPDFDKVIYEGYIKEEAVRLVGLKAAPEMGSEDQQRMILKDIDGIGALQQYFRRVHIFAHQARMSIESAENALDEIAEEGTA